MVFTNLNVKSHYSLLNSTLKIDDIISNAIHNNYSYVSLVDQSYFSGALEFIIKAKKNNLTPILGLEFKIIDDDLEYNIIAYAKNTLGFKNLEKISSKVMMNTENKITIDDFNDLNDNLIFVIDILSSIIYQDYLINDVINQDLITYYKSKFRVFYYYYANANDEKFYQLFNSLYNSELCIIANDIYYQNSEDASLHYLLNCIKVGKVAEKIILQRKGINHLLSYAEVESRYHELEIRNTSKMIVNFESIDLQIEDTLPLYKEDLASINEYLKQLCLKGLVKRLGKDNIPKIYLERLMYELNVVIDMGFANYFLVVYDYVLYARKNNILVGPGRGSSAGSLIAYCLGITNVDPIENKLIFERFLNPERISLPDIDVDFQDDKREQIVEYLKDKYGHDHIAHIITFGTFQAKNSLRDLARVLEIPNYRLDLILKLIPNVLNLRLVNLINESKQLQVVLQSNDDLAYLYKQAIKLEGINRHSSTHAAGIIIGRKKVIDYAPLMNGLNNTLMLQYSMDNLEQLGLYKMDILGLKNLGILSDILNDLPIDLSLANIPLNDKETLALISKGSTLGVFQFESQGVIKVLKKMGIDSINDMVATTALFRPGPMQYIDEFIARKNKVKQFNYTHDDLKDILEETYGIIVYQEQIMQICQKMAGFSLAKADVVRKGMAKKDKKLLDQIKDDFINSSINRGYSKDISTKVYDMILLFSNYGFNKAHAYSYALLGYYLAYLKANYPQEFFKNVLSANTYSLAKVKQYLFEMKQVNMNIVVPNINISSLKYEIQNNNFVLPFVAIKGFGENNAQLIIDERYKNGDFIDYFDTIVRLHKLNLSSGMITNLIYAGAFDCFEFNRKTMVENLTRIEQYIEITRVNDDQIVLQLETIPKPKIIKHANDSYIYEKELDLLGLYLSNHPLDKYLKEYQDNILDSITLQHDALVIIDNIKEIRTKKGELMAFISVSDLLVSKSLVVFPRVYKMYKSRLKNKNILLIKGEIDDKDSSNVILKSLQVLE